MRRRQRPLIKEGRKPSNLYPTLTLLSKTQKKRTDGAWLIETLRSRPIILQEGKANIIQEDFLLSLKRALGRDVRKRLERYFLDFLIRVCGRGKCSASHQAHVVQHYMTKSYSLGACLKTNTHSILWRCDVYCSDSFTPAHLSVCLFVLFLFVFVSPHLPLSRKQPADEESDRLVRLAMNT